jgi:two-component sensor histidine kinase
VRCVVKNTLAVVQTLAGQTFRGGRAEANALAAFNGRLNALAKATEILTRREWRNALVGDVVDEIIRPYRDGEEERFEVAGPSLEIDSKSAVSLGMGRHELCTKALKYGALSDPAGHVSIKWEQAPAGSPFNGRNEVVLACSRPQAQAGTGRNCCSEACSRDPMERSS